MYLNMRYLWCVVDCVNLKVKCYLWVKLKNDWFFNRKFFIWLLVMLFSGELSGENIEYFIEGYEMKLIFIVNFI